MRIKLKIRQKIFLLVLTASAILYVIAIGYILSISRKTMLEDALENARLTAQNAAKDIEKTFERDLALTRTLAQAFTVYQDMPTSLWQDLFMRMYYPILEGNKHVYSIWDSWEYYGYVPNYDKDYGRFCITLWRENNKILGITDIRSVDGDPDKYGAFKIGNQEGLWEPYFDEGLEGKSERVLMTTVASPIQISGKYFGLIGLDISLESLQEVVSKIEPVPGSFAFLVSSESIVAAHHNDDHINVPLKDIYPANFENENLGQIIKEGKEHSYYRVDAQGRTHFMCFAPIIAGNSYSSWSLALSIPLDVITSNADESRYISLIVGISALLILIIILVFIANNLTRPIVKITNTLMRLSKGEISDDLQLDLKSGDEIEMMANALNTSIDGLNKKSLFAIDIENGQLESNLDLLSDNDVLGKSLIDMRNSLKKAKDDEEQRSIEDRKRTWANEGFANFANILRNNSNDLQQLADEILKNLVKYIQGNQGALFLINEEDKNNIYLEMVSVYATDRKKHIEMKIMLGEGLVGACALEKETILLTDIPNEYITIASGLGEANPNCVLLVPLKQDEKIMGVFEAASFKVFEEFEIDFVEKVAESIAATVATVKINEKTRYLLEQSQQQAEEMQAQEEEMRQNMEELLATQEEMARKEKEIAWTMDALGNLAIHIEYDFKGIILYANTKTFDITGYSKDELIGKHHSILFDNEGMTNSEDYRKFWEDMQNRKLFQGLMKRMGKQNNLITVKGLCHPVFDDNGQPLKIVELAVEVNELVNEE
jgi:PAS domain S-box-containing protein